MATSSHYFGLHSDHSFTHSEHYIAPLEGGTVHSEAVAVPSLRRLMGWLFYVQFLYLRKIESGAITTEL